MPYASVNGVRLYYETHGRGEHLVMLPGMGSDHSSWLWQLPAFRGHYMVVTFDPRSIGKSSRPNEPYSFRSLADDVAGLMDHLAIKKANVLGQSLGGLVAQEFAIDYPDRVLKLVLLSTTMSGADTSPELMAALGYADGTTDIDFSKIDTRRTMNTVIEMSFNKLPYRKAMQFLTRFFLKPEAFDGVSDQIRAASGHSTVDRLHLIKAQTLVITGTRDRIIPPRASEALAASIPNAKLVMVKGGSHGFNVEMTGRFNREVLDFLRGA